MPIKIMHSDLLKQDDVDAIVNTVNCVGVMGKGIALQFKNKWPKNFRAYADACKKGDVAIGRMFVFEAGGLIRPHFIINFPTKDHWRGQSRLEYIRDGLIDLVACIRELRIASIAIPPLGCGNGGLDWSVVRPMIEKAFASVESVDVRLFSPEGAPAPKSMDVRTDRPRMTPGRVAILQLLETYKSLNYGLSRIEVQKLAYFLQEAGEPLRLTFSKDQFGPYSDRLRHALNRMDGHFIQGVGDGVVESDIEPLAEAMVEAALYMHENGSEALLERVERVRRLIDGFQSPYGVELLASVHWVAKNEPEVENVQTAVVAVHAWSRRKRDMMRAEHIAVAWGRLASEGWLGR